MKIENTQSGAKMLCVGPDQAVDVRRQTIATFSRVILVVLALGSAVTLFRIADASMSPTAVIWPLIRHEVEAQPSSYATEAQAKRTSINRDSGLIIDAHYTREQALSGSSAPESLLAQQELVELRYWGMDGRRHQGQIVVHRRVVQDVREIFQAIDSARFPLKSVIPIVRYRWDDDASIAANNTSGFNYRTISGTNRLSKHAEGIAIDLNPYLNPWRGGHGRTTRPYDISIPGTLQAGDVVVRAFENHGWTWGGKWSGSKDYQHFDKR